MVISKMETTTQHGAIHSKTQTNEVTFYNLDAIIADRANHTKPHMGLTTWKSAPDGKIISTDVMIVKNYLTQEELEELNNIVVMFLDYAENQARRQKLMGMDDWALSLR